MSTCSVSEQAAVEEWTRIAERLCGRAVLRLEPMSGGRNSRVYAISTSDGERFALKVYFPRHDSRDGQWIEFAAFRLLHDHRIHAVPTPLARDSDRRCSLFEFVNGDSGPPAMYRDTDLAQLLSFVAQLQRLSRQLPDFPHLAAEAVLHGSGLCESIERRVTRLTAAPKVQSDRPRVAEVRSDFRQFLHDELIPCRDRLCSAAESLPEFTRALPLELRLLSPSDFGWHNAIQRPDGSWTFIDFEHFGWDDPVKFIGDFLLHPALNYPAEWRRTFVETCCGLFADDASLQRRLHAWLPLLGLKWCAILLNEFLPEHAQRRNFALGTQVDQELVLRQQLAKARHMLARVTETSETETLAL